MPTRRPRGKGNAGAWLILSLALLLAFVAALPLPPSLWRCSHSDHLLATLFVAPPAMPCGMLSPQVPEAAKPLACCRSTASTRPAVSTACRAEFVRSLTLPTPALAAAGLSGRSDRQIVPLPPPPAVGVVPKALPIPFLGAFRSRPPPLPPASVCCFRIPHGIPPLRAPPAFV